MATFVVDTLPAQIVVPGGAHLVANQYISDGATEFSPGDIVRINTSGQVVDAATDNTAAGSVHGMVLTNAYSAVHATAGVFIPVLMFTSDTILMMQIYAASATDAQPQDLTVGVAYTLRNPSAGIWEATVTTSNGNALCVGKPGNTRWFDSDYAIDKNYGFAYFRFIQSILDGHAS